MSEPEPGAWKATAAVVLPYVVWMALMMVLPSTAGAYAVRTAVTAVAAVVAWTLWMRSGSHGASDGGTFAKTLFWGLVAGLVVLVLWVLPERWAWYREFSILGALGLASPSAADAAPSPYEPSVCGWPLACVRLFGSAFVIAPVEEVFFRSFLYRWLQRSDWTCVPLSRFDPSAFAWMVGIFALEHHTRLAAGAMAGALYGMLAIRKGLGAAIVAHVVTNLGLGLWVFFTGEWGFW